MAWRRRVRHSKIGIWHFVASFVSLFLLGNIVLINRGFTGLDEENYIDSGGTHHQQDTRFSWKSLTRQVRRPEDHQIWDSAGQYNVFESRLRKLMENTIDSSLTYANYDVQVLRESYPSDHLLDCDDITNMTDRTYIASGWTKAVYRGVHKGKALALKTVDIGGRDVSTCVDRGFTIQECYVRAAQKILKEIVVLQALASDNVIKVLGFCIPNKEYLGDGNAVVSMATELGETVDLIKLLQMSWEDRLRISYDMTRLLVYMANSPYGSMAMNDFRRQQFVRVDGQLKLSDVDDVGFHDPTCSQNKECNVHFFTSNFTQDLPCVEGRCNGFNEKRNIFDAGRQFTTFLLPHGAPSTLRPFIDVVVNGYGNLTMNAAQLLYHMEKIVELYKSGKYLNRDGPDARMSVYKVQRSSDMPGRFDYRCRYSLSGNGCTISVFDQQEAETLCDNDPECKGFVMSNERTWSGRHIVHLKNGVGAVSFNPLTQLFVRPSDEQDFPA